MYHSVGGGLPTSVPSAEFTEQMTALAERFRVVRLRDLPTALRACRGEENLACVTFDDGFLDNVEHALPVLDRLRLRATFFPATGFLGGQFVTHAGSAAMMSAAHLRLLTSLGHEVGSHTVTHAKLSRLPWKSALEELRHSKDEIESVVAEAVVSLAYPKGDETPAVRALAARSGYRLAVTVRESLVHDLEHPLGLPRVAIRPGLDRAGFDARISPAVDWVATLRGCVAGAADGG
jgi:peptidoglycan/xylan/chitin deacetylase (PgdA/CDA1 family)